jgi:hypothetical protein
MDKLSKKQALNLLPAIVDGEATKEERIAFFSFIETNDKVREEYESALRIKELLAKRLPKVKAPSHLRKNVFELIESAKEQGQLIDIPASETGEELPPGRLYKDALVSLWKPALRYIAAAAVLLFITLTTVELLDRTTDSTTLQYDIVENYTAIHFLNSEGRLSEPHFRTSSITEAEQHLLEIHGISMTVPPISGAEFAGLFLTDFYNGFETPLLGYYQPDIDETIFVFAFEIDKITAHGKLKRHGEAVKSCKTNTDFFVAEIENHHVVSWTWDGNWYTAVSNHNGYDLASLIEPLGYSP